MFKVCDELCMPFFPGKPVIYIHTDSFTVDSQDSISITGNIGGHPPSNVTIYRDVNGMFEAIDSETENRFNYEFNNNTLDLIITLDRVVRADAREYRIVASNPSGSDEVEFPIVVNGELKTSVRECCF